MKNNIDFSLLESGDVFKRGFSYLANNAGRVIAVITFLVATLVIFTDVTFCDFHTKTFTSLMTLMLIASYITYFSLEEAGEKLGEDTTEYKTARESYEEVLKKIDGSHTEKLRSFCKDYTEQELKYRRENALMRFGYTYGEYESYKDGAPFDKKAVRAFRQADRMKIGKITPTVLLTKGKINERGELKNPESTKFLFMMLKLIPSTVCMMVTVSVVLSAKESLSAIEIIDGILKLSSLPIIGFKGYSHGYNYTKRSVCLWLDTKTRLLKAFLSSTEGVKD